MSILTKDELLNKVRGYIGEEDTSDEALNLYRDISDTLGQSSGSDPAEIDRINAEWKQKLDDKENEWRTKFRDQFFAKPLGEPEPEPEEVKPEIKNYSDLFK